MPPLAMPTSIPEVCDIVLVRGVQAGGDAPPDVLIEVPHGATRASHFADLRAALRGSYPDDLEAFFFVNTDVGAPEVAARLAQRLVQADPALAVLVVRCLIPRTFIDCNRVIDADARAAASDAGAVTPGLQPWVGDEADRKLLLRRYGAYREAVAAAFALVCGSGGTGLMLHSYAPRSIEVPVDEGIVDRLRAAYEPGTYARWPLRPEVDFITRTPDGETLADEDLVAALQAACAQDGLTAGVATTYPLHPSTLAHVHARRYPARTLCLELRRDLLVQAFTPFHEMDADPSKVDRLARILERGLATWWAAA